MKRKAWVFLAILLVAAAAALVWRTAVPFQRVPEPARYIIVAVDTGEELARVSVPVSVGDQLITRDNRVYVVVKVRGHTGFAEYRGGLPP